MLVSATIALPSRSWRSPAHGTSAAGLDANNRLSRNEAKVLLLAEAAILLCLARIFVLTVPFRVLARWLSHAPDAPAPDHMLALRVGRAVAVAARNVPWNAVCLPQAMAAKAMLALRGQGSACHLGATIEGDGKFSAHAWLECDGRIVTGASGMHGMSHLVRFG